MKTGDIILTHDSTPAELRKILERFKFRIGCHPFKDCTATGNQPTVLLTNVPDDYLPDVKAKLDSKGIVSRFIRLEEVEVVSDESPAIGDLVSKMWDKELEG